MRILVISQYFHPENFRINDIVFSLKKRGHYLEVLTGKPNYPRGEYFEGYSWGRPNEEEINGIKIHRSNLVLRKKGGALRLFLNYFSFIFFSVFKFIRIKGPFDKIFIFAPSPITVGFLGIFAAKKFNCKSYLWVHDLWPESIKVAGGIKNKLILSLVNLMTIYIYKKTDKILIQSPKFKNYIMDQKVPNKKIMYYPYYAEDFYKKVKEKKFIKSKFPEGFNFLFAGNIGMAQSFDTIVNAIEKLKKEKINIIVLGDGRDKKRILELVKLKGLNDKFYFLGTYPPEEMPFYFASADALLITLRRAQIFRNFNLTLLVANLFSELWMVLERK